LRNFRQEGTIEETFPTAVTQKTAALSQCLSSTMEKTSTLEEKQEARSLLRKEFLQFIQSSKGKKVTLTMMEGTQRVEGIFEGCNPETSLFLVSSLETSLGKQDSAIVRASDLSSLKIHHQH